MPDEQPREVKTILVAIGPTPESAGAAPAALRLAGALGASVHAALVIEPVSGHAERAVPGLSEAHERQAREDAEAAARAPGLRGAALHVARGSPAVEVLRIAKQVGADLIAVGRYGKAGRKDGAIGSIAERIVRNATVSVLAAPPDASGEFRRIGVATDFSEGSDLALRRASGLCRSLGASELVLLHAFEVPVRHHMIASHAETVRRLRAVSEQLATEQAARVLGPGLKARVRCDEGDEAEVVARLAGEERLDLLIIGAYSRTLPAAALLGRTGERIVRQVQCPVWAEKSAVLAQGFLDAARELLR